MNYNCPDWVKIVFPLAAFGIGAAIAKTPKWRSLRNKLPAAIKKPLHNPIVNGIFFAVIVALVVFLSDYAMSMESVEGRAGKFDSLLPAEMYGYAGLSPSIGHGGGQGADSTFALDNRKVQFDNNFP